MVTMSTYIPYSIQFFIAYGSTYSPKRNNFEAACYLVFHAISTILSHTISIWLTVSVALFRCIYLSAKNGKTLCSMKRAYMTIAVVCIGSVCLILPQILMFTVNEYKDPVTGKTWYVLDYDSKIIKRSETLTRVQYILMAIFVKIGPSFMLIILSAILVRILIKAQKNYQKMVGRKSSCNSQTRGSSQTPCNGQSRSNEKRRQKQTNQTTKLLTAVAIVFTLAELPQGILFGLTMIETEKYEQIFYPMGNLLDLMTIISCTVNFVLYSSMSHKYRIIFVRQVVGCKNLLCQCFRQKKPDKKLTSIESTKVSRCEPTHNDQDTQLLPSLKVSNHENDYT